MTKFTEEQIKDRQTRILAALAEAAGGTSLTDGDIMGAAHTLARMDLDQFNAAWERRKSDFPDWLPIIEGRIIGKLLDTILADPGLVVTVNDGEDNVVKVSRNRAEIERETGQTGETYYIVSRQTRPGVYERLGFIWLVHGNEVDVISDYADKPEIAALVAPAEGLAEKLG